MWDWIPDPATLLRALGPLAERWQPHPGLELNRTRLSTALVDGADRAEPWLRHPCTSRLTRDEPATAYRDLVLALWAAAHTDADLGSVTILAPVTVWTPGGDLALSPGRHDLRAAAAPMEVATPIPLAVDVWCTTTGLRSEGAFSLDDDVAVHEGLARNLNHFVRVVHIIAARIPELMHWLTEATKVVRPLVPVPGSSRSTHYPEIAGLVEADLSGGVAQTIELITHETAHLHLRAAQADDPLVHPGYAGRHPSPLRPDPRPLIGILLAYHALAYICAALLDAARAGLVGDAVEAYVIADMATKRDDARWVLEEAEQHLTDGGRRFLHRTHEVSARVPA